MDTTEGFTTQVPVAGIPITGETEITDSAKVGFWLLAARTPEAFSLGRKRRGD